MKHFSTKLALAALLLVIFSCAMLTLGTSRSLADPQPLQQAEDAQSSSGSTSTSTSACNNTAGANGEPSQAKVNSCITSTPIWKDVQTIVNFLSAGVGVIVAGVIIVGGIQYILAGGNASALTAARQRITNGLIALFAFLFIVAFLNWLIPGGVFHK